MMASPDAAHLPLALEVAAVALRRLSASHWEDFLAALAAEQERGVAEWLRCLPDDLQVMQGRLQAVDILLKRMRAAQDTLEQASRNRAIAERQRSGMAGGDMPTRLS
jgi:hypothetical protein